MKEKILPRTEGSPSTGYGSYFLLPIRRASTFFYEGINCLRFQLGNTTHLRNSIYKGSLEGGERYLLSKKAAHSLPGICIWGIIYALTKLEKPPTSRKGSSILYSHFKCNPLPRKGSFWGRESLPSTQKALVFSRKYWFREFTRRLEVEILEKGAKNFSFSARGNVNSIWEV